jgi:hypothetical protein
MESMHLSPFFHNLRSAYQAELDDMRHDSEGQFVLERRLAQRRGEIGFLVSMLETSPEMVAVVFHKAFRFSSALAMDQLLTREPEDLPDWDELGQTIVVAPWAEAMITTLHKHPGGDRFLTVAAALEYMAGMPGASQTGHADDDGDAAEDDPERENRDAQEDGLPYLSADDAADSDGPTREEAGADWLAEQGFDRKD